MLVPKLILDEINEVRTNPAAYAEKILKYKDLFEKNTLKRPDGKKIKTQEGPAAYEEAANFLKSAKKASPLTASKGLTKISEDLYNAVQHCSPSLLDSRVNLSDLIQKYGSFEGNFGRLMEFGGESPEHIVIDLIVSDGDPSRSQRDQLMDNDFKFIGLVNGDHPDFTKATIITLTYKFNYNADPDDVENY